jgi:ketosteroid isomerase-like protein
MGDFGCKVRSTGKASLSKWVFIWKFREAKVASFEQFHDPQLANAFR